jgi:hypothetical protein
MNSIVNCLLIPFIILGVLGNYAIADEDFLTASIDLPFELENIDLIRNIIIDDISGNSLNDLIVFAKNKIYIFEQESICQFSACKKLSVDYGGIIDIGDVIGGDEKEILIMHKDGIFCFKKNRNETTYSRFDLIQEESILGNSINLKRGHIFIDLNEDGKNELILWKHNSVNIYNKFGENNYKLAQSIPYESKDYFATPGLTITNSPWAAWAQESPIRFFDAEWPNRMKYIFVSKVKVSNRFLFYDYNKDLNKDFISIQPIKKKDARGSSSTFFEYRIHFSNEGKEFSTEPDYILHDVHGAWISPNGIDLNNDGLIDFIQIETEIKDGLIKKHKSKFSIYIAAEDGSFHIEPDQMFESTFLPFLNNLFIDVDGDQEKDLVLIEPITRGFSIGSILNKFISKGTDIKIWILPYRDGVCFSKKIMMKKVKMKFLMGIPINLEGDFTGDGKKDLLMLENDAIRIFPLIDMNAGFAKRAKFRIKLQNPSSYIIQDVNNNRKSDLIFFSENRISLIVF